MDNLDMLLGEIGPALESRDGEKLTQIRENLMPAFEEYKKWADKELESSLN